MQVMSIPVLGVYNKLGCGALHCIFCNRLELGFQQDNHTHLQPMDIWNSNLKKTLKCCCASRVPILTSHDVISLHDIIYDSRTSQRIPYRNMMCLKWRFSGWPMTLTMKPVRDIIKVNPCTKFCDRTLNGSAVRALTDTQIHRRLCFYNLDSWRGR